MGSALASLSEVRYLSSVSAKERVFLLIDVVKLVVRCASHTGITTFILAAVAGHGNLEYYYIGMLSYITLKFNNTGIIAVITVVLAGLENYSITILKCCDVKLPSFKLDSIDKSSSVRAQKRCIFAFKFRSSTQIFS